MTTMVRLPTSSATTRMNSDCSLSAFERIPSGLRLGKRTKKVLQHQIRIKLSVQKGFVQKGLRKGFDTLVLSTMPRQMLLLSTNSASDKEDPTQKSPFSMQQALAACLSLLKESSERTERMKPSWTMSWMMSCPLMETTWRREKKELGGSCLLREEAGCVRLMVMKMGKVMKRSSQRLWSFVSVWQFRFRIASVVNWISENRIIMLNPWKLVDSPARQIRMQVTTDFRLEETVQKLERRALCSRSSSRDSPADSQRLPLLPTAQQVRPRRSSCPKRLFSCFTSILLKITDRSKRLFAAGMSRFMNSSSQSAASKQTFELRPKSSNSVMNSGQISGVEDRHSMWPLQARASRWRLREQRRSSFFLQTPLNMAFEAASSSGCWLTKSRRTSAAFSCRTASRFSSVCACCSTRKPRKVNWLRAMSSWQSCEGHSAGASSTAQASSMKPFSAMSTMYSNASSGQLSRPQHCSTFSADPFRKKHSRHSRCLRRSFSVISRSIEHFFPFAVNSFTARISSWCYKTSSLLYLSCLRTGGFSLNLARTAIFMALALKRMTFLTCSSQWRVSKQSSPVLVACANSNTLRSTTDPCTSWRKNSSVWQQASAFTKQVPMWQNSLRCCTLRWRSARSVCEGSVSWQASNSLTEVKARPKPRSPFVPMAAECTSQSFPNTSPPCSTIVSILPPVRMNLGITELMPCALSRRVTKSMPRLRMVGSVGGMAVMSRSMKMRNMSSSPVQGPRRPRQAKQTMLVSRMIRQMKQIVSRKNCSSVLLWQRIARRYFPRRVLKFVCVTRHTISFTASILSPRIEDSIDSNSLSRRRLRRALPSPPSSRALSSTDSPYASFLSRCSKFLILAISVPRWRRKLFSFSFWQVKFSISSLRIRQLSPVLYFSLTSASPRSRMQSQGTRSSSLRMMMSPGTSRWEDIVWKQMLRLFIRLFYSFLTSRLGRRPAAPFPRSSRSSPSPPLKLSFMRADLCSSSLGELLHSSTSLPSSSSSSGPSEGGLSSTRTLVWTSKQDSKRSCSWLARTSEALFQQVQTEQARRMKAKMQYSSQIHRMIPQVWKTSQGVSISCTKMSSRLCTSSLITFSPQQSSSCARLPSESGRKRSFLSWSRWWPSSSQRMGTNTSFSSTQMQLRSWQRKATHCLRRRISNLSVRSTSVASPALSSSRTRKCVACSRRQMLARNMALRLADHRPTSHRKPSVSSTPRQNSACFAREARSGSTVLIDGSEVQVQSSTFTRQAGFSNWNHFISLSIIYSTQTAPPQQSRGRRQKRGQAGEGRAGQQGQNLSFNLQCTPPLLNSLLSQEAYPYAYPIPSQALPLSRPLFHADWRAGS